MEEDRKGETEELDPDLLWNRELQRDLERHSAHYRSRFSVKHEGRINNSGKTHGIQAYGLRLKGDDISTSVCETENSI